MLVGVVRIKGKWEFYSSVRCPHARGGGPITLVYRVVDSGSCPHARGGGPSMSPIWINFDNRCPHARGGGPCSQRMGNLV